jgi:aspartyl protease family protein
MNRTVVIALSMVFSMGLLAQGAGTFGTADPPANHTLRVDTAGGGRADRSSDDEDSTEIVRDSSGQFRLNVAVNGQDAGFLVDTGADTVALTVSEAQRLGFDVDPETFQVIGQSASGEARGKAVNIDVIDVAGSELRDVDAVVIEGLEENLLGQTVLARLDGVELRGDRMLIHRR